MASKTSMPVTIPATQAHRQFGDLIRRVYGGAEHFVVERDGFPVAAIISIAEYEALMKAREQREHGSEQRLARFRQLAREMGEEAEKSGLTEEELMAQIDEIRQQLYDDHYRNVGDSHPAHHG